MRLKVRRVFVTGLPSESRARALLSELLALGDIIVLLTYFYLAEGGGVNVSKRDVNVSKRGVYLSPPGKKGFHLNSSCITVAIRAHLWYAWKNFVV